MSIFKITNTTNLINRREGKYNTPINIEYFDMLSKKTATIKPEESMYIDTNSLPTSVLILRQKKYISISEISVNELQEVLSGNNKPIIDETPVVEKNVDELAKQIKKKSLKKEDE